LLLIDHILSACYPWALYPLSAVEEEPTEEVPPSSPQTVGRSDQKSGAKPSSSAVTNDRTLSKRTSPTTKRVSPSGAGGAAKGAGGAATGAGGAVVPAALPSAENQLAIPEETTSVCFVPTPKCKQESIE